MPINCPGSESYSHIFGVSQRGATPLIAFLRALIVLIWEIANSRGVRDFLDKKCERPCEKIVDGPTFGNMTVRIRPSNGRWLCIMGGVLEARIECQLAEGVPTEASDQELLQGLAKVVRGKGHGKARG